jgi:probable F420-dependent oxidoreductase
MRFSYAESMTNPAYYGPLAKAAEAAGFHSMIVPDSICYPKTSDSKYPYTPDGNREFLEDKPFIEPFALIPSLGAVTTRLCFNTFVVKLPIRNPVLTAKQAASVAVLTDNRFGFGVGVSPWPDDYRIVGVPWERRGKRMDEMIEIIKGLCAGGFFEYHGEIFDIEAIKICPVPTKPLPILIGGHGDAALKRAARLGDGWMHAGGDPVEMERMIARIHELRRQYGRDHLPFEIHVISFDAYTVDGVRKLEAMGVTDVIVGFRNAYQMEQDTETVEQKVAAINWYASEIIAKL